MAPSAAVGTGTGNREGWRMARVLFIVNQHPNEAFSTAVARETAKLLRAEGHTVVFAKVNFGETTFGKALAGKVGKRSLRAEESLLDKKAIGLAKSFSSPFVYNFHCTPSDSEYWHEEKRRGKNFYAEERIGSWLVEVKAAYRPFPERLRKRIEANPAIQKNRGFYQGSSYLMRTSSHQASLAAGINPGRIAEELAETISQRHIAGSAARRRRAWRKNLRKQRKRRARR